MATFGERLRGLVKSQGYTLAEIGKKTGIDQPSLSRYIHDQKEPRFAQLKKLCRVLHCRADYLLDLDQETYPNELILLRNAIKEIKELVQYA